MPAYSAPFRSAGRLLLYVGWVFACIPVQAVALALRLHFADRFPQIVNRVATRIMGARVVVRGAPVADKGLLLISNHCSYADISVLGGVVNARFVAKAEVAKWPIFGWCARLSRTVFVDRRARFALVQAEEMKRRFRNGDRLILFAEGTTSDGNRVLPFRSSLFATAEIDIDGRPVTVQPVSIAYTALDGMPLGRHLRPFYAWYGDMDMFAHLWALIGLGRVTAVVEFHRPVSIRDFGGERKKLALYCQAVIASGVSSAISGRKQPVLLPPGVAMPGGGADAFVADSRARPA